MSETKSVLHKFIPLRPAEGGGFSMLVDNSVSVGRGGKGFMFGGAGLAASVAAMEAVSGRAALWATAQYLSYAKPGSAVTISCVMPSVGKYITQARATIRRSDTEILTAAAALGEREGMTDQWAQLEAVAPPEECEERRHWADEGMLGSRFQFRPAHGYFSDLPLAGRSDDGRLMMWVKPVEEIEIDRIVLAVIADFLTPAIRNATGRHAGGNSLDNTIRYCAIVPTQWVLCDILIEAIANGITHGTMRIFAESGELMASASQSMILRVRD